MFAVVLVNVTRALPAPPAAPLVKAPTVPPIVPLVTTVPAAITAPAVLLANADATSEADIAAVAVSVRPFKVKVLPAAPSPVKVTTELVVTPVTPSATLATTGVPGARPAITGAARSVCAPTALLVKVTVLLLTTAPLSYAPTVPLMVPPLTAAAANTVPVVRFANALATCAALASPAPAVKVKPFSVSVCPTVSAVKVWVDAFL